MTLDEIIRKRRIAAWRADATSRIWCAFHLSGRSALDRLAAEVASAGLRETYWDPAFFAAPRIDATMRECLRALLTGAMLASADAIDAPALRMQGARQMLLEAAEAAIGADTPRLPAPPREAGPSRSAIRGWAASAGSFAMSGMATIATSVLVPGYGPAALAKPLFAFRINNAGASRLAEAWVGTARRPALPMADAVAGVEAVARYVQGED